MTALVCITMLLINTLHYLNSNGIGMTPSTLAPICTLNSSSSGLQNASIASNKPHMQRNASIVNTTLVTRPSSRVCSMLGRICSIICKKQCKNILCNSRQCNIICKPGSRCTSVKCGKMTKRCSLDCQDNATCNLNCEGNVNCKHSCALSGICKTKYGDSLDVHNGQCGNCNCTRNVRNCTQRCEGKGNRCLELYCDATAACDQHSSSTTSSFVYRMRSYSPIVTQFCHNNSDCWQMVCYGTSCTISCLKASKCDYMICKADSCIFNCFNQSTCDVMHCLKGSRYCRFNCDASSTCRIKKCEGAHCFGAHALAESGAEVFRFSCLLAILLFSFILVVSC